MTGKFEAIIIISKFSTLYVIERSFVEKKGVSAESGRNQISAES